MKFEKSSKIFEWIGEGVRVGKRGNKTRYKAFKLSDLEVKVGDFVLVRNDDALDPEDIFSSYVAQVNDLFDTGEEYDPFQAQVQWFSRILELPSFAIRSLKTASHEYEVVQDKRTSWQNTVDAETIFQKCVVLFLAEDVDFDAELSKHIDNPSPVFVCRYAFTGVSLVPIVKDNKFLKPKFGIEENTHLNGFAFHCTENIQDNVTPEKGQFPTKSEAIYCAIPTGSPEYPRVLIKKIDDKILECQKGNVGIFVADPKNGKVDSFTDKFLKKLKFESLQQDKHLEKKPTIHNLSPRNNTFGKVCNLETMCEDSIIESECVKTLKNLKNSTPSRNKSCKKLFVDSTQNAETYSTPKKKAKVIEIDILSPRHKMNLESSEDDIAENFSSKLKLEKDFECNGDIVKKPLIHSLTSQDNKEKLKIEDIEWESEPGTPRTRRSCVNKSSRTPLSNKSCKKVIKSSLKKSPNKYVAVENSDSYSTPKKTAKFKDVCNDFHLTRSGRRVKAVNYSENIMDIISTATPEKKQTPNKRNLPRFVRSVCSDDSDSDKFSLNEDSSDDSSMSGVSILDEISPSKKKYLKKVKKKPSSKRNDSTPRSSKRIDDLCIPERKTPLRTPKNALEESRQRLHVSAVPSSLPCRGEEYSDIYNFVKGCLCAQTGGCMYISGVPGTGKTATVHEVIRNLEEEKESGEVPLFRFVEVNGMWMIDPYQCYVQIFKALSGKNIAPQQAADLLEKRFTERGPKKDAVVLLVDELDRLWTRKQTVMYNIFDWPTKKYSKLIVLAIANTMDLPERMMMNRISSRLGLTRKTFQPYTFKQLQEIVMSRIQDLKVFDPDAVQLVARKVAAVSGDARRALDICRFATETVKVDQTPKKSQKVLVGMEHVDLALQQMFSSPVISAIKSSSKITKLFFRCLLLEFTRSGLEETTLLKVHHQVVSTCRFEGFHPPNSTEISRICSELAASHLILVDNFRNDLYMKIRLNVSSDDVTYALTLE